MTSVMAEDITKGLISRTITVIEDFDLTGKEALVATGREVYVTNEVVTYMPAHKDGAEPRKLYVPGQITSPDEEDLEKVEIFFFNLDPDEFGPEISDEDLDTQYAMRGLEACDPYTLTAANQADPAFADEYPNATHWKDSKGLWCFALFGCLSRAGRHVRVRQDSRSWGTYWWFAGVRKRKK